MKKLFTFLNLAFYSILLVANPVSKEYASQIALNYYKHYVPSKNSDYSISDVASIKFEGIITIYAINFNSGGFILVSADDATIPILGYSFEGNFLYDSLPSNTKGWIDSYCKEIKTIIDLKLSNSSTIDEWNNILNKKFPKDISSVLPLLNTSWDQGCYYNDLCPYDAGGDCNHVYTGCVATAMAQIMKFWNYPNMGNSSHSYTDDDYGYQSANFGTTTYNWSSMPDYLITDNTAIATLMYHCGVSVDMDYGVSGSSAFSSDVPDALINYFSYQNTAQKEYFSDYTTTDWINLLKSELDASRPIFYRGTNGTDGHAFVCDGYNSSNYFHFNWGWSGSYDGYYAIGSLTPGSHYYNNDNAAIIYIQPPVPILDCNSAINLTCGQNYNGTTVGGNSNVSTYNSCPWNESGPENIHLITTASGDITVTLSNMTVDLDVFILSSCDGSACQTYGDITATYTSAPAGNYYIVVDGYNGVSGSYTLNVACTPQVLNCSSNIPLTCGQTYNGTTVGGNSNVSVYYSQGNELSSENGPEKVHIITISNPCTLTVNLTNMSVDLDLFILNSCNVNNCIAFGYTSSNELASSIVSAGTYYIVVDGYDGTSGSYTLTINCQPIADIKELPDNLSFNLYPNPTTNNLNIEFEMPGYHQQILFTLYNSIGQNGLTVTLENAQPGKILKAIDIGSLNSGIYQLQITLDDGTSINRKVVIQK